MELEEQIAMAIRAHRDFPKEDDMAVRRWDGETPYSVHSIWGGVTLLHETELNKEFRECGSQALFFHDILEDTNFDLLMVEDLPERTREFVDKMTFESSAQEMELIWGAEPEIKLLKLYDKVSNLMDGAWMSPEKKEKYTDYTKKLTEDVEENYGQLNIVKIAKAITGVNK